MPRSLLESIMTTDGASAARLLEALDDAAIADLLSQLHSGVAIEILEQFDEPRRQLIADAAPDHALQLWHNNQQYDDETVGRLMERAVAVFRPSATVQHVIDALREKVRASFIVYVFVTDADYQLVGVVAFRELLFAGREQTLAEVMVAEPFFLHPEMELVDAMRDVVTRHYPAYPVCDGGGRLLGLVRGQVLFQQQAFEISAQAGSMVGVEKEERINTPWWNSFKSRHPWLQLNLLTAFIAAGVVGYFQDAINQIVLLAVFLPVLSGQCGNTGCQTLAVTLRGMTLGELKPGQARRVVLKEAWLGWWNGLIVGLVAAAGMFVMAHLQKTPGAGTLALITAFSMATSCMMSGAAGALIPLGMKRLGADPATASGIFLSTATDVVSMGVFLGLATWLLI